MHILGAIGALIIGIVMLPDIISWWDAGITATQQRLVANHMLMVTQAARQYVNRHQDTLLPQAQAASGPAIGIQELVDDGFLPDGFQRRNPWLQDYEVHVRQPQAGTLQAIVLTTGGRDEVPDKFATVTVPGAAALVGGAGGFIPLGGVLPGMTENLLQGAGNGWSLDLASVGITSPGAGHLGAVSSYDSSALGQDFLYRVAVPGQPELNAMQAELDMTDHAIRNVSELQFEPREITDESCASVEEDGRLFLDSVQGLYLCRNNSMEIIGDSGNSTLVKTATVVSNGATITKPLCAPNSGTSPAIFTAPALAEAGAESLPMSSLQTWATSLSDTEWQVHLRVLTSDNAWVNPAANYGRVLVLSMCVKQPQEVVTP